VVIIAGLIVYDRDEREMHQIWRALIAGLFEWLTQQAYGSHSGLGLLWQVS